MLFKEVPIFKVIKYQQYQISAPRLSSCILRTQSEFKDEFRLAIATQDFRHRLY